MVRKFHTPHGQAGLVLKYQPRKNYGSTVSVNGENIKCYTKKQMKSLYPQKDFVKAAEYSRHSNQGAIGTLDGNKNNTLYKYGSHNRLLHREKGFIAVEPGADRYVALLQNVLIPRIAVLMLCLAIIAAGAIFVLSQKQPVSAIVDSKIPAGKLPEIEQDAVDWEGTQPPAESDGPLEGIRIPGYKSMTIKANKKEVTVNLLNPEQNKCYFVIRMVLTGTGETLYESKMIEPGKGLYKVTLAHSLKPGTYKAQLQYEPYDLKTVTRLNGAVMNFDLIAE